MIMFCMDDMVPQNHMLRLIDKAIDWDFIYDLVEENTALIMEDRAWIQLC